MLIQTAIENKLTEALNPSVIEVVNESYMHAVPEHSETHFKIVIVSDSFANHRLVKRHQMLYQLLSDELAADVHALALHTFTPNEWHQLQAKVIDSPQCMGNR